MLSALIPVKGFTNAKQRLSPILAAAERELLAETMLRDVLRQVVPVPQLDKTFVVTVDKRISDIASSLGACVIQEETERGETEAVVFAFEEMKHRGIRSVLVLPADIPLVRSSDIELLLDKASGWDPTVPFALLVPSHDHMGTNALLLSPPEVIKLRFGTDSFRYHLGNVAARGLPPRILENKRIGLDIDEPKDLQLLLSAGKGSGDTYEMVLRMGVVGEAPNTHQSEKP
ncbi:MAG: 2-phospho-L-lactate guanylyltransferase [Candidatus Binatia bacterium]